RAQHRRRPVRARSHRPRVVFSVGGRHTLPVDAGQIDELRRWGERLAQDESHPELRPAGRAILLLVDEVERLRSSPPPTDPPEGGEPSSEEEDAEPEPRRRNLRWNKGQRGFFRLAIAAGVLGALVFATFALGGRLSAPALDAEGPSQGAGIGPALLPSLRFS